MWNGPFCILKRPVLQHRAALAANCLWHSDYA